VRENWRRRRRRRRKKPAGGVREVREKKKKKKNRVFCSHFIFLEMVRCHLVNGRQKTLPFCPIRIAAALPTPPLSTTIT
jgi:hypothetical protein